MAEKLASHKIYPYSGSQNSTVHPALLDASDIVYSDNIIYTLSNTKKIRPGLVKSFNSQKPTGSEAILSGIDFNFWSSTDNRIKNYFVYAQKSGDVIAFDKTTQTHRVIKSGINVNFPIVFETFYGLLVMCVGDRETIPQKWNGTTPLMSDLFSDGSTYKSTICRKFLNKLWIDDPTVPGRAIGSVTNDPTDFSGAGSETIDFNVNDGDPVGLTAFLPPKDKVMYVGKWNSLYSLTPTYVGSTLVFVPNEISTNADIGVVSHNGCTSAGGSLYFPSQRGYHRLITSDVIIGLDTQFASAKIQADWTREVSMQYAGFISACYSVEHNSIFVLYPRDEDVEANHLFGYSLISQDWYSWYNFNQSFVVTCMDATTRKNKATFLSRDGDIGVLDDDYVSDYGKFYTMKIKAGVITPNGIPEASYEFKFANFVFTPSSSGTMSFAMLIDGKHLNYKTIPISPTNSTYDTTQYGELGENFILGLMNLGGVPSVYLYPQELKGSGTFYTFLIQFTPTSNSESLEILGILVDVIASSIQKKGIGG